MHFGMYGILFSKQGLKTHLNFALTKNSLEIINFNTFFNLRNKHVHSRPANANIIILTYGNPS